MHLSKEEQILSRHFADMVRLSYQRGIPVFSHFAGLHEAELAGRVLDEFYGKSWQEGRQAVFYGGYQEAERRVLCFLPEQYGGSVADEDFPISCVMVKPSNRRFGGSLSHRDCLGAAMNLGLTRDQLGDILVQRSDGGEFSAAYIFCKKDKEELLSGLSRVGRTAVEAEGVDFVQTGWKPEYREVKGSVSSLRLDAVLSMAVRVSRSQGLGLIQEGNVFLNGRCCTENAKKLSEGDIISVRGYGKFLFEQTSPQTKKGRFHVTVKQYV